MLGWTGFAQGGPGVTLPLRLEVDDSPVYEVVLGLLASTRPDEFQSEVVGNPAVGNRNPVASTGLRHTIERLGGRHCAWDQLLGFASQMPPPRTVARFLDQLARADPLELVAHLIGFYADLFPAHLRAAIVDAADGSRTARHVVTEALSRNDAEREAATSQLLAMPGAQVQQLTVDAVRGWYEEVFSRDEAVVSPLLAGDAGAKRALLTTTPELLIRIATGVRYVPKPWVEAVLLIPSIVLRPWLVATDYKRMRIYCYAIADDTLEGQELPSANAVRMYQALASATRLRIIKSLAESALTLDQLGRRLDVPGSALRPHLAVLRAARLVLITCAEEMTYELRDDLMAAIGQPLRAYLE